MIKVKTQTRFMVLFTSGSSLKWGNLQALCLVSPPGIYRLSTLNNCLPTSLQRLHNDWMCFLPERWRGGGKDMIPLWGSLNICPHLNYLELLHHSPGELLSISSLKIWGDVQEPHNNIAYLLVCTGHALEAQNYGMFLVWISPNQVQVPTMEEAVGTLSTYISSRPDWPYALAQLYEGSSHTPLPKDKHLGILPQGKVEESPYGQIS